MNISHFTATASGFAAMLCVLVSCGDGELRSNIFATVDNFKIKAPKTPDSRKRGGAPLRISRAKLNAKIAHALLFNEARRRGIHLSPQMTRAYEEMLVNALIHEERTKAARHQPTEEEVSKALAKLRSQIRPRMLRLTVIWTDTLGRAENVRSQLQGHASRLQRTVLANPGLRGSRSGDLGFLKVGRERGTRKSLLKLALALPNVGDVSAPTLVDEKWALVVKTADLRRRRPGRRALLRQARSFVTRQRQRTVREALLKRLRANASVVVNTELVEN